MQPTTQSMGRLGPTQVACVAPVLSLKCRKARARLLCCGSVDTMCSVGTASSADAGALMGGGGWALLGEEWADWKVCCPGEGGWRLDVAMRLHPSPDLGCMGCLDLRLRHSGCRSGQVYGGSWHLPWEPPGWACCCLAFPALQCMCSVCTRAAEWSDS